MNKALGLFFVGIICGFLIEEAEAFEDANHPEDISEFLVYSVSYGGFFGNVSYYIILIFILPTIAVPQIKNRLGTKAMYAYYFAAGITFWGAIDGLEIILK